MTTDHPIRRFLARVCSDDTMTRVVDPTLGDVRFEDGRLTRRGCLALARALAFHAITSSPGRSRRIWREDEHAVPKAVIVAVAAAILLCVPLIGLPAMGRVYPGRLGLTRAFLLLLPQALVLALPAALLVAIPRAFRRTVERRRVIARGLVVSLACAMATSIALAVTPDTNQAFRVAASGQTYVPRGPNEMGFRELRERIQKPRIGEDGARYTRTLEYTYHLKLALACISIPLGLLASAITASRRVRRWPVAIGTAAVLGYVTALIPLSAAASEAVAHWPAVPAVVAAWLPTAAIIALAVLVFRRSRGERAATA